MTIKVALAGAGAFGIKHLDGLKNIDDVEVVSVIGRDLDKTREVAAKYGIGHVTDKLEDALARKDVDAVKTHNPFAVNDIAFARDTGYPLEKMNNYGCSLIWGHPQAPTGMRLLIELIEELALLGGGYGLFSGCAAGDTAAAVVIRVDG